MPVVSFVIPAYNESENIRAAIDGITKSFIGSGAELEFVFVDDGSSDNTWELLFKASEDDGRIKALSFSRNFGKEAAIFAGLSAVTGEACIVMDCDLQHPPQVARRMFDLWHNNPNIHVVEGKKRSRGSESTLGRLSAKVFYGFFKRLSGLDMSGSSDFKLITREVIDALNELPERYTFFRALTGWVGFESAELEFDVPPRAEGETKWSFFGLLKYALNSIVSFSSAPMQIVTVVGMATLLFAIVLGIQTLINFFTGGALGGFTTVILIVLFIGSIIMLSLGVIGHYISKIYDELKCRPRYIIARRTNIIETKGRTDLRDQPEAGK